MNFVFSQSQIENYANVLLWGLKVSRKKEFSKGDVVIVRFDIAALPLAEAVHAVLLKEGLNPVLRMNPTATMQVDHYQLSAFNQLKFVSPGEKELMESANGLISLIAPESLTHLSGIDPEDIAMVQVSRKFLRDILDKREDRGEFSWTLCMYPTKVLAETANLSLEEYTSEVVNACQLNMSQAAESWQHMWREIQEIKNWLNGLNIESVHVESDNVDLHVGLGSQRRWLGLTGHNIPSFEIYTSPDWRLVDGVYFSDLPSYRVGNLISNVRLEIKGGLVRSLTADQGEAFARRQISMDDGACRVGEFSLTDKRFSRISKFMANTLYDENHGGSYGNAHLALGSSYSDTFAGDPVELDSDLKRILGYNSSTLHWDLVNTENKRVTAKLKDGKTKVVFENGQFTL